MREVVDFEGKQVDTSKLRPLQRIWLGIVAKYHESRFYQVKRNKKLEEEYRAQSEREELLKSRILRHLYDQFVRNTECAKHGTVCVELDLIIPREYEEDLKRILRHKDFISYYTHIPQCDPDLLKSFPDIGVILETKSKTLGGASYVQA